MMAVMAAAKQEQPTLAQRAGAGLASLSMAATLMCGAPAIAGEFDIINTVSVLSTTPTQGKWQGCVHCTV